MDANRVIELTVLIAEEACGLKRPEGMSAAAAYEQIAASPELEQFERIARIAAQFADESRREMAREVYEYMTTWYDPTPDCPSVPEPSDERIAIINDELCAAFDELTPGWRQEER